MIVWNILEDIAHSDRDAVVLALSHAGYTVRLRKHKEWNKTVWHIEYSKEAQYETY